MPRFRSIHHCLCIGLLFSITLLPATGLRSALAEEGWRIGLATAKITPEEPIRMSGYASRKDLSEGVLADLYANAMAIDCDGGDEALLITADVIGFRAVVAQHICDRISKATGLERRQILLNGSHTHTGPVLQLPDFSDYGLEGDHADRSIRYTEKLVRHLVDIAKAARADRQPAKLSWGVGEADFVMNRRESTTERGVILGVNPEGHTDKRVPVLRVDTLSGELRALIFSCACHNTTLTGKHMVLSGDYAGFAQIAIERDLPGVQAMFMIGCAGAANPHPRSTVEAAEQHGESLAKEVCRVAAGQLDPITGPLHVDLQYATLPLQPVPSEKELKKMMNGPNYLKGNAQGMLDAIAEGKSLPTHYDMPIALWQFGEDLTLVGLSGEVVSDFVPLVEAAIDAPRLWILGYCNDVYGYLPSVTILEEGGYETRGLFLEPGFFAPEAQDATQAKVRAMGRQMRKKLGH